MIDDEAALLRSIRADRAAAQAPVRELDFEAWVDLSASLSGRAPAERAALLEAKEITEAQLRDANLRWVKALGDDLGRGERARAGRYAARIAEEHARRAAAEAAPAKAPSAPPVAPAPPPPAKVPSAPPVALAPSSPPVAQAPSPPPVAQAPSPPPPVVAPSPPPPPPVGPRPAHTVDVATVMAALGGKQALPFAATGAVSSLAAAPRRELPRQSGATVPFPGSIGVGAKAPSPLANLGKAIDETALSKPPPGLTLEQYASLCAEIAVSPERTAEIARRYHVPDEAAWQSLHQAWQTWLARDRATWERWRTLEAEFREWLHKRGAP